MTFYQYRPIQLVLLGGLIAGLLMASTALQRAMTDRMRALWDGIIQKPATAVSPSANPTDWVYRLRSHRTYRRVFALFTETIFPFVFGFGCLAAVGVVLLGTANRMVFAAASAAGSTCVDAAPQELGWRADDVGLRSSELCQQTGLELQKGQRYRVEVVLPDNDTCRSRRSGGTSRFAWTLRLASAAAATRCS